MAVGLLVLGALALAAYFVLRRGCGGPGQKCCTVGAKCRTGPCGPDHTCPCGAPGKACCPGANECQSPQEYSCQDGECKDCGQRTEPCCAGGSCGGLSRCVSGTCVSCGELKEPCCASGECNTSLQNLVCKDGACVSCGSPGEPCCGGRIQPCDGVCFKGTCYAGRGQRGQPCNTDGSCDGENVCGADGLCVQCGEKGEVCCANLQCNTNLQNLTCLGGACVPCGSAGMPCCEHSRLSPCFSGTCDPTTKKCG